MRRSILAAVCFIGLIPWPAHAEYTGNNYEALVQEVASAMCGYSRPVLQKQVVRNGFGEHQFICDSGFIVAKVVIVSCMVLPYKVRPRNPGESADEYATFQNSITDPRPWFGCKASSAG